MSHAIRSKTLSIPVNGPLYSFVEERLRSRGFTTVSEYVRQLIRDDQQRAAREALDTKLLEAIERGDYRDGDESFWRKLRERAGTRGE